MDEEASGCCGNGPKWPAKAVKEKRDKEKTTK